MFKPTLRLYTLLIFLLSSVSVYADKAAEVNKLLSKSGLNAQIESLPAQFSDGVRQGVAQSGGPEEIGDQIVASIGDGISAEVFLGNLANAFNNGLTLGELKTINTWYETPLAEKITQLEVNASTPEQSVYVMENLDSLLSDHERIAMARRVEEVLGGSDMMLTMMRSMQVAMINTLMVDAPQEQREIILEQIEQQIEMSMPQLTEMLLAVHVHTYSSLSDDELGSYLKFLGTSEATKFHEIAVSTMGTTIGNAIGGMAPAMEQAGS